MGYYSKSPKNIPPQLDRYLSFFATNGCTKWVEFSRDACAALPEGASAGAPDVTPHPFPSADGRLRNEAEWIAGINHGGQVWNNVEGELWSVIYELENTQTVAGPNGGFEVVSSTGSGSGFLVDHTSGFPAPYELTGKANADGLIFALLADGHRLPDDNTMLVALGWIEGTGNYNDWLVTTEPVPVPAALPLFATALAGLGVLRARSRKQS